MTALIFVLPLTAFAEAADPCKTQNNTMEINACGQKQFEQGDKALNQAYQALLKKLSTKDTPDYRNSVIRPYVITAQRAWITFRENDCKGLYTYNEGGTLRNVIYLTCMTDHAAQRTKDLKAFTSQEQ
ncbi:uncharacterized protein YecT (DUF1311 family) [Glaciimonas immobilis]|uniref:Uncharacterized protein YecT (DUF1311 family) n=1 Tax=Glaciimonas immobilis TaxID=728004 RepID=A0A840RMB8_9BURK|nr:lysozyme inhibitor LprI family protein [Glaciimonas immobilis]KAF3999406.1 DUF1311 domain-containing protein [Glaciimonas immobilis]MBB5198903.1 uncharacterized protein YecT (DUF1311 family) [Glaciimonas immobilis]